MLWANIQDRILVQIEKGTEMTSEQLFGLVIVVIVVVVVASLQVSKNRHRIKRVILDRLNRIKRVILDRLNRIKLVILDQFNTSSEAGQRKPHEPERPVTGSHSKVLTAEEKSKAEFARLQKLIENRKQIARDTDISHHLWGLYKNHFRNPSPQSLGRHIKDSEWYDMKILRVSSKNGLNEFDFELKGAKYKFVDDEEKQGWRMNMKYFSLFLYDDSDRCLIETPMKVKVDRWGSKYSISSDGPNAFLPGDWTKDFINVKLKNQRIRNQEIRAQKHQERLYEIDDLKDRFGISD